ncbi:MAG: hypothetical protein KGR26_08635, partial [Cyanobacteria bacterium REEB65]|nr:hypothetical protein [Cyanobacteria bacterium REEB65]
LIAFVAGAMAPLSDRLDAWSTIHNPFYGGPGADALTLLPFALLALVLYRTGRQPKTPAVPLQ